MLRSEALFKTEVRWSHPLSIFKTSKSSYHAFKGRKPLAMLASLQPIRPVLYAVRRNKFNPGLQVRQPMPALVWAPDCLPEQPHYELLLTFPHAVTPLGWNVPLLEQGKIAEQAHLCGSRTGSQPQIVPPLISCHTDINSQFVKMSRKISSWNNHNINLTSHVKHLVLYF